MAAVLQGRPLPSSQQRPSWKTGSQVSRGGKLIDVEISGAEVEDMTVVDDLTVDGSITVSTAGSSITQGAWTAPTMINGWVDYGSGQQTARWRKDTSGTVHIQGCIKNGTTTAGTVIFGLPVGARPDAAMTFGVDIYPNAYGDIAVLANGNVTVGSVHASYTWLNFCFNV